MCCTLAEKDRMAMQRCSGAVRGTTLARLQAPPAAGAARQSGTGGLMPRQWCEGTAGHARLPQAAIGLATIKLHAHDRQAETHRQKSLHLQPAQHGGSPVGQAIALFTPGGSRLKAWQPTLCRTGRPLPDAWPRVDHLRSSAEHCCRICCIAYSRRLLGVLPGASTPDDRHTLCNDYVRMMQTTE